MSLVLILFLLRLIAKRTLTGSLPFTPCSALSNPVSHDSDAPRILHKWRPGTWRTGLSQCSWSAFSSTHSPVCSPHPRPVLGLLVTVTLVIDEINFHDPRGYTALHVAAKKGATALTQRLLELGAKVDDRDRTRHTPLHFAAATGHTTVVNVLLHHGADVNARSADGSTPLHYAALYGFEQIVLDLLQRGAECVSPCASVRSPPYASHVSAAPSP